ncbi:unknown [Clostridium sp. CAG:389]|jgi:hypothetical protein|nr:unknown [Clostridium sp. CAG:389]
MNISPKRDIEGAKTDITVMAIAPLTNTLDKEQKNGDGTKVIASGEFSIVRSEVPVIDTKTENNIVTSDGRRQLADGTIMKINISDKRRDLQKAIMVEQKEQSVQEER